MHSTNTRITDVEVIEKRTPVLVRQFSLRPGSGGAGLFKGGDGIIRIIEARMPMKFSIVSTRRTFAPYGMAGGKRGAVGKNLWVRRKEGGGEDLGSAEFGRIGLGGMAVLSVGAGDRVEIHTPGKCVHF